MHRVPMKWLSDQACHPDPLGDFEEWLLYVTSLRIEAEIHEHGHYHVTGRWVSWR